MASGLLELPFLTPWRGSRRTGAGAAAPGTRHIGDISRVVAISGLDTERFTARDVLDVLDAIARELGLRLMDASHVKSPLGYLATLLRRVSGYVDQHGWTTRAEQNAGIDAERRARRQEAARRAAEAAAERERLAAPDEQAAIEAVLEQMRRDFPRDERP
jgi:multidrug efflux pump subunit AcrA (membrane-fusion protein)